MCNAGVYKDGDPCTSILIFDLFLYNAKKYKDKMFNLFFNDYNSDRVLTTKKIIYDIYPNIDKLNNINVYYNDIDVNEYLTEQSFNKLFKKAAATILYVDPYDFGTVKISKIANFLKYNYCEVLFNVFTMDVVRNGIDERIKRCIDCNIINDKDDLISKIAQMLKVSKVKYSFSYEFKNQNNTELYQILYATPNIRGLEKLKEAVWKVFKGKRFHRNKRIGEQEQMCIFTEEDDEQYFLRVYSEEAKELLISSFKNNSVSYEQIETLLLEKTMLREGQLIKNVIQPLIDKGFITKKGKVSNRNYKKDNYEIKGDINENLSKKEYALQDRR